MFMINGDQETNHFLYMCNLCRYVCPVFAGPVICYDDMYSYIHNIKAMYAHTRTHAYTCTHTHTHTHTHTLTYVYVHRHTCIHIMHISTYTKSQVYTYIIYACRHM